MKPFIILFVIMLSFTPNAFAQIQGDVVDTKDKGIANSMIVAIDSIAKVTDTVRSDKRGFYEFKNLKPGKYKIEVKANGFKAVVIENIIVKEGDVGIFEIDLYRGQRLDIILTPAKVP